jgi:hypothetical protein
MDLTRASGQAEDELADANESMGEALTAIGMALGLPKPRPGATWGASEILPLAEREHAIADAARRYARSVESNRAIVKAWRALRDITAQQLS